MSMREEADRAYGATATTRGSAVLTFVLRLLLLFACALVTTLALGGALLSRTPDAVVGSFIVNLLMLTAMVAAVRMFRPMLHDSDRAMALLGGLVALIVVHGVRRGARASGRAGAGPDRVRRRRRQCAVRSPREPAHRRADHGAGRGSAGVPHSCRRSRSCSRPARARRSPCARASGAISRTCG